MTFNPDPKPISKPKKEYKGINRNKVKSYTCTICKGKYKKKMSQTYRKYCDKVECKLACAMKVVEKNRIAKEKEERKAFREKKRAFFANPNKQEPLQKSINEIVRILDKEEPCYVFPHYNLKGINKQAGHVYTTASNPTIKYFLGQIFGESVYSNANQSISSQKKLKGVEIRHGKNQVKVIEWVRKNNKSINLNKMQKDEKLAIANEILREIKKGKQITRREIDERLGIYVLPEFYEI